jgi:hypothetical protein
MGKGLRNAALLGGAALLASKMMGGSKDKKSRKDEQDKDAEMDVMSRPDMDTTGDASAGMAKDRMSDLRTAAQEAADDAKIRAATNNFGRGTPGRVSASQAADAAAAAKTAGELNRERAAYLSRGANQDADAAGAAKTAADFRRDRDAYLNKFSNRQAAAAAKVNAARREQMGLKKGGSVKASSASKRADGCAQRGKTKGRMI